MNSNKPDPAVELINEILKEIKIEEQEAETKRQEIIRRGCPHPHLVHKKGRFSKKDYLECDICYKTFEMDGTPIEIE